MLLDLRPVVITTCVGYWDYLAQTLPHTLVFAQRVYIVTTLQEEVPEWVAHVKVDVIRTSAFREGGAIFNKSAALREAQLCVHAEHPHDWILLLDADIIAAPDLCHDIVCRQTLYSVSRLDYLTRADYDSDNGVPYHTPGAGYFQLYHDKSKLYPHFSKDASECDMDFYRLFPKHRILGGAVKHLGEHTVNWRGRVSHAWA
jgi:glycosyltransferase involved in cell wall biosynthesis